ncbi:MAG: dihydrofolate reductase family protein [Chitinophagaceae bacterium]|nr:dihydrofolate reductase family protein [Chitinophagaceae bacterium]
MGKLIVFEFITLNGFYKGPGEDIGWHKHGEEEAEFSKENFESDARILLFGRVTFEMMASYWPTDQARQEFPEVAKGMNASEKIVFSRTLKKTTWQNSTIVADMIAEIKRLKKTEKTLVLLGSGKILSQLANEGLIDEYQIMIDPVALGTGTSLFGGVDHQIDLKLVKSRMFKSGVILLHYHPA